MPKGTEVHVGFFWLQSKHTWQDRARQRESFKQAVADPASPERTLFPDFAFNFSNILSDSCFGASAAMVAIRSVCGVSEGERWAVGWVGLDGAVVFGEAGKCAVGRGRQRGGIVGEVMKKRRPRFARRSDSGDSSEVKWSTVSLPCRGCRFRPGSGCGFWHLGAL